MKMAWNEYGNAKHPRDRLDALRLIRELDEKYLDELERFGVIERPANKNLNLNIEARNNEFKVMMEKWRDSRKKERETIEEVKS